MMGNVSAIRDEQIFGGAGDPFRNRFHLGRRSILVFLSLNHKDRAGNTGEVFLKVPVVKSLGKPRVSPASECPVGIASMILEKAIPEVCRFVDFDSLTNARQGDFFNKNVSRFRNNPPYFFRPGCRKNE